MKKQINKIPELKEKFVSQCPRKEFGEYVWFSAIEPQLSYAFAEPHALAYSFIAIQILVLTTYYPIIYWNTACLITNSGGDEYQDNDEETVTDEDESDEEEGRKKVKTKNTDYGKIASAIGNFQNRGITVMPPDINQSSFTFVPDAKNNAIIYGLRGITRIPVALIHQIIDNRPYTSLNDFLVKNQTNKLQTLNLIKSGAFDHIENKPREEIMHDYLESIADKKTRLTLQNMQMLIDKKLIPDEMIEYKKLFLFNKFLKTQKNGVYYQLNAAAFDFITSHFDANMTEDGDKILQKTWDNFYKKAMEPMRAYLKAHQDTMLAALNQSLYDEVAEKYTEGTISKWEMDSISFYYHTHELAKAARQYDDFYLLPEEPELERSIITDKGYEVKIWRLHQIIGTVIDKDKIHNTVTLLTPTGVVTVKIYKNQFAMYDKQISQIGEDGKKHVLEKSWLTRGNKLMIQGIRRENTFIPKKRSSSTLPIISKITSIDEKGNLTFQYERLGDDEN